VAAKKKLKDKHRVAIDAYFANGLDRGAALRTAGYSEKTIRSNPQSVFAHPDVAAEIERRMAAIAAKSDLTLEMVIAELRKIGFAKLGDLLVVQPDGSGYFDLTRMTEDQRAALAEFSVEEYKQGRGPHARQVVKNKMKFGDKKGALELLARYFGAFKDQLVVTGELSIVDRLLRGRERVKKTETPA